MLFNFLIFQACNNVVAESAVYVCVSILLIAEYSAQQMTANLEVIHSTTWLV